MKKYGIGFGEEVPCALGNCKSILRMSTTYSTVKSVHETSSRKPLKPWNFTPSWRMAPLTLLLFFSSYKLVGFMFLSLLFTSLAVFLSTVVFMWKHQAVADDELVEGSGFSLSFSSASSEEKKKPNGRESVAPTPMHKHETVRVREAKESGEEIEEVSDVVDDAPSESECQEMFLSTSEEYEVDHTPECSDGTISDEDSLIEIALPSGHFVGHNQREDSNKYNNNNNCCSLQQKKRGLSAHEALFNQQSLMEFLAEFNEEENLIEIDLAMGSIKCSRLVPQQCEKASAVPQALDTH
ncbi:unnamed protein product [Sphenostylis stenocarpa]|uniref:Uncharacterized protein n=1 Tax=Sphenostylis stenocarpa TaxID=92480 RepID=A0AA86T309_9FABA|nr:unnamed protein product [Sphenostylis stenocarpa]